MADIKVVREKLATLVRDARGANMVEYIIIVGVIAFIAVAGFSLFGSNVQSKMSEMGTSVGGLNGTIPTSN